MPRASRSGSPEAGLSSDLSRILGSPALRVDRDAIPGLRRAFTSAITKLDRQIELAVSEIRVRPWAGDPVSAAAADELNQRAVDSTDSALATLQAYQRQLKSAMDALTKVEEQYELVEGDNTALLGRQGGC